jgi:hypothetical protein
VLRLKRKRRKRPQRHLQKHLQRRPQKPQLRRQDKSPVQFLLRSIKQEFGVTSSELLRWDLTLTHRQRKSPALKDTREQEERLESLPVSESQTLLAELEEAPQVVKYSAWALVV